CLLNNIAGFHKWDRGHSRIPQQCRATLTHRGDEHVEEVGPLPLQVLIKRIIPFWHQIALTKSQPIEYSSSSVKSVTCRTWYFAVGLGRLGGGEEPSSTTHSFFPVPESFAMILALPVSPLSSCVTSPS